MGERDHRITVAFILIMSYLILGTFFYHRIEGWSYVDSFYFTGVTLTTVGYGDFTPTHDLSKIVTVFFAMSGVGTFLYAVGIIGKRYFERREKSIIQKLIKKK
jgi:voltage-gated potassium channel Kch